MQLRLTVHQTRTHYNDSYISNQTIGPKLTQEARFARTPHFDHINLHTEI